MYLAAKPLPPALHFAFAIAHVRLGQHDTAIEHLQQMVEAHAAGSVFIGVEPGLQALRGDRRFEDVLRRVGSPMASTPHTASP
jgi:hypothetical protein